VSDDLTIVRREGVCGGEPIITGTRITVDLIWKYHYKVGWDIERIMDAYPQLSRYQVQVAIQYGNEHPEVIKDEQEE
jgi:uncharacterized protein (DUF433 family)